MKDSILKAYQAERASASNGKAPELVPNDHIVALLASQYSENDLRQAAAMRGAFNRQERREVLAQQRKTGKAASK